MSNISAVHEMWEGDVAPAAPPAGYVMLYALGGRFFVQRSTGVAVPLAALTYVHSTFFGEAVLNQIFGGYKPLSPVQITGAEVYAQEAPAGAALQVTLVDGSGTSLGAVATLPTGSTAQRTMFGSPVSLVADATLRLKLTQLGSTTPGSWITVRLLIQP